MENVELVESEVLSDIQLLYYQGRREDKQGERGGPVLGSAPTEGGRREKGIRPLKLGEKLCRSNAASCNIELSIVHMED